MNFKELYNDTRLMNNKLSVELIELDDSYNLLLEQHKSVLHDTERLLLENERLKNIAEGGGLGCSNYAHTSAIIAKQKQTS